MVDDDPRVRRSATCAGADADSAASHCGACGAAGRRAAAHARRGGRLAPLGSAARRAARRARQGRQRAGHSAPGARPRGRLGAARRAAARRAACAGDRRQSRSDGHGDPAPRHEATTRNGARPAARGAADARGAGGGRTIRAGSGGAGVSSDGRAGRGRGTACRAPGVRDPPAHRHGRIDRRDGGRADRPRRVPDGGAGRGRRSLDGAHAGRQEPHARVAVSERQAGGGSHEATLIAGDGIGPEITQATLLVLDALGLEFDWDELYGGVSAIEKGGTPLPDATVDSIRRTGLALKGPLTTPVGDGYRSVNVALRQEFELYANVRPVKSIVPGGRYPDVDLVIIRENTEGMYVGFDRTFRVGSDPKALAQAMSVTTRDGCRRIVRYAFEYARQHDRRKVTVVHKANILKATSGLFLETAKMIAKEYEGQIASDEKIVDNAAMQLVINPAQFDVIVTTNLFGDILSDEASGLVGGLGLAPGANIGTHAAIFEAVHGSAPDIAGQGIANPSAQMLAAAMMLDHVGELEAGQRLRHAIETAIVKDNVRTKDLGGSAHTAEFASAVARRA